MKEKIVQRNIIAKMLLLIAMAFFGVFVFTSVPEVRAEGQGTSEDPFLVNSEPGLQDAVDALNTNDTVYVKVDGAFTISSGVTINSGKTLVIDLDGNYIAYNGTNKMFIINGTLTLNDNSTYKGGSVATYNAPNYCMFELNNGQLSLNNVDVFGDEKNESISTIECSSGDNTIIVDNSSITSRRDAIKTKGFPLSCSIYGDSSVINGNIELDDNSIFNVYNEAKINGNLDIAGTPTLYLRAGYYKDTIDKISSLVDLSVYSVVAGDTFDEVTFNSHIIPKIDSPYFAGHSLVLTDEIGVDFYVVVPVGYDMEDSYVSFEYGTGDKKETIKVDTDPSKMVDGKYKYTVFIGPIQLAEKITPTLYYTEDGVEKSVVGEAFSAEDYIHAKEDDGDIGLIVQYLNDYGYYTQQYMIQKGRWSEGDYALISKAYIHYDDPDVIYTYDEIKGWLDSDKFGISLNNPDDYLVSPYYSVKCGKTFYTKLYFKTSDGIKPTVEVDDYMVQVDENSNGYFTVMIPSGYANVLVERKTVTINDNATISLSPISYSKDILYGDYPKEDRDLACAIVLYAGSAYEYDHEH